METLEWSATTQTKLPKAFVFNDIGKSPNAYWFTFDKLKRRQFLLYPKWNMTFQGTHHKKDNIEMMNYVREALLEYTPLIELCYCTRPGGPRTTVRGKLHFIHVTHNDDGLYEKHNRRSNLRMYVVVDGTDTRIPQDIYNIRMKIRTLFPPRSKYHYGFCHRVTGRFIFCTPEQYIKYGGFQGKLAGQGPNRCRVMSKAKGPIHYFCGSSLGT